MAAAVRVVKSQRRAVLVRRCGSVRGRVRGAARRHGCAAEVHGWHALRELCVGSGRTCDETMEVWQASRRQAWRRQAWRRQPWRRQPWRRQAWHAGPEADAEHLGWCRVEG